MIQMMFTTYLLKNITSKLKKIQNHFPITNGCSEE